MIPRTFKKTYKKQFDSTKHYDHFKTLGAAPLPVFPASLLAITRLLDQGQKPSCTAYSAVAEREAETGKQYDPEAQWQEELNFLGLTPDQANEGIQLDQKFQVGIKVGFTPIGGGDPTDKAAAYFWVKKAPGLDYFDSVRLAMLQLYQKYGKVIPFSIGVNWYEDWDNAPDGILTDNPHTVLGGHDTKLAGFETFNGVDYIVNQGSWGPAFGDKGIFRISRTIFNKYFGGYGVGYWSDDTTTVPAKMNLLVVLLQNLVVLYQRLIAKKNGFPPPTPPAPQPPAPATPTYIWDNPADARHSVRVICDEEGLTYDMQYGAITAKNIMCACVQVESGFKPGAVHQNKDPHSGLVTSTDYGIVQINDFFHIGPGKDFPSVQYVLDNPEACVRWMAKLFKNGKANLWSSYQSGVYKKYL